MSGSYLLDSSVAIDFLRGSAAHAIQHDVVLVARDAHFSEIDGLKLQGW